MVQGQDAARGQTQLRGETAAPSASPAVPVARSAEDPTKRCILNEKFTVPLARAVPVTTGLGRVTVNVTLPGWT